ncbi:MAG: Gfo/Idh/MocA family oxidoreductase [Paracoccaceae bacterium]
MSVTTAIIGLGIMGRRMLEHMDRHEGYTPVALWDPDATACAEALKLAPEAVIAETPEAAIAAADLVYLACPPVLRKAYALAAAAAGKAVFLEKPLGVDVAESEDLVARLAGFGVPAAANFTQAAGVAMTGVAQAAQSGALGEVLGADIVVTYGAWPRAWQVDADWLRFRAEGGMTREVISHFLFFSERILGPLKVVWARPSYPADDRLCETHMLARLEAADGRARHRHGQRRRRPARPAGADHQGQQAQPPDHRFLCRCGLGRGRIRPGWTLPEDPRAASLKAQLDDLLLLLDGRPSRLATPAEALRVQKLVEAMLAGV